MSTNTFGLPSNRKLYRVRVELETEGGDKRPFDSVLLTYDDAASERTEHAQNGRFSSVILDKDAALAYQEEVSEKRKQRKGSSH